MEAIREDLEAKLHINPGFEYMKSLDDNQLVESSMMGNKTAFNELYMRYEKKIYAFVYRILKNHEDTQDIIQMTFLRAYLNIGRYAHKHKFSTWLFTIANNLAKSKIRDDKWKLLPYEPLQEYLAYDINKGNGNYAKLLNAVEKAISNLGRLYVNIAFLRFIKEFTYEKIAETENLNLNTIKSRIKRARFQLKQNKELKRVIYNYL